MSAIAGSSQVSNQIHLDFDAWYLSSRGVLPGPIQDGGDIQFFEIRDTEGHLIEICKEP